MSEKALARLFGAWGVGWFLTVTYWLAFPPAALIGDNGVDWVIPSGLFGAIFWPFYWTVRLWEWVL